MVPAAADEGLVLVPLARAAGFHYRARMKVRANGIELEVALDGPPGGAPILLVSGFGAQLIGWDSQIVDRFVARGLRVIAADNRDSGLSQECEPAVAALPRAGDVAAGRVAPPYTLDDMAADMVGVLDALGVGRACVCGRSMGGMIGQLVALTRPDRVTGLVSIYSSTGARDLPGPEPAVLEALLSPPPPTHDERVAAGVEWARLVGGTLPFDAERARVRSAAADRRALRPDGARRQQLALIAAADRTEALASLKVPALVIHGDADPLIPAACGKATAAAIPGASYVELPGMGHDLPPSVWDVLVEAIADFALECAAR